MSQSHWMDIYVWQFCEFQSYFASLISQLSPIFARHLFDSRETFVRVSHNILTNKDWFHFHSNDSCDTFMRVSNNTYDCRLVLFSCQIVMSCLYGFSRLSYNNLRSISKLLHYEFAKISHRQVCDTRTTILRQVREYFCEKNLLKFLNCSKPSWLVRDTWKFSQNSPNSCEEFACQWDTSFILTIKTDRPVICTRPGYGPQDRLSFNSLKPGVLFVGHRQTE